MKKHKSTPRPEPPFGAITQVFVPELASGIGASVLPLCQPPREKTQVHSEPWAGAVRAVDRGSKATLPLTIPRRVFKSSAKDSTRRSMGITIQGGRRGPSAAGAWPTTRASGDREVPTAGRQTGGGRTRRSSPDSDLEAFSHNPAHGRADIEGSKSNVAMNAWLPQASYPCGNFSDTSSFKFRRSKGSIGHAFTVRIRTENQNQTSFYPFVPHEISVLVELILGHLRYLLTDVPPQPNSPPDNVFRPDRPPRIPLVRTSSESTVRRPGKAPERTVPSPSPGRHAATRSRRGGSSSSPPTADGFGTGTPVPSPQSQSFSRSYGSILPTSLAYIVPSTRGCSPWRPDAVMSTTGRGRHSVLRIFKGRRGRTGHRATCGALPAAGPYLRLSRFQDLHRRPLRPGSRPGFCGDRRALLLIGAWHLPRRPGIGRALKRHPFSGLVDSADERFARQYRCGPPPEFPLASPRSGIVHHLSGPDRHAHTRTLLRRSRSVGGAPARDPANQLPCALRVYWPVDSHTCQTPWSVFQDGPNGEPAGRCRERAGARSTPEGARCQPRSRRRRLHRLIEGPGLGRRRNPHRSAPRADRRTGSRRSASDRGASPAPIRFPPDNFKHSLTLFSKSFSSFPRGTCLLSVSRPYLALDGIYRPIWAAFPNNPTRRQRLVVRQGPGATGLSPSPAPLSRGLGPGPPLRTLLQTTIRTPGAPDFQAGLFPVRSPLLRESCAACAELQGRRVPTRRPGARRELERLLFHHRSPRLRSPRTQIWANRERRALGLMAWGATCVQRLDGSRDSAIHTKYRISLRSSSMREPRYPLPRVVLDTCERRRRTPRRTVSGAAGACSLVRFPWRSPAPGVRCFASRERDESLSPRHGAGRRSARCGRAPPPAAGDINWFAGRSAGQVSTMILPQAANRPRRRDPNTSPDHSIGRSDGRCVQRAGT
ncbi:hypothetical protein KPL70_023255 [Citrus sinensis]|nr:hypothetical protein KPL70_023255 [Citrus sinensis]